MFSFHCSQCSRKSISAGTPRCLQCGSVEPRTTVDDNFNSKEPEAPRQFGAASGSKNHLLPNDTQMTALAPIHDRKRKEEKDQMIPGNSEGRFEASKGKRIRPVDDIRGVPGPSGLNQNNKTSNLSEEKSQSVSSLQLQTVALTDEKSVFCVNCRWEIDRHSFELKGKTVYKCCYCAFISSGMCNLQKHATIHDPSFLLCNICGEFNFETDAHGSEKKCDKCEEKFKCRTLLEEHYLVHEEYFYVYCRCCRNKIDDHITAGQKRVYECCECDYQTYEKTILRKHLYIHTDLRLFKCDVCGRRSKQKSTLYVHLRTHFKCKKCEDSFTSTERLEEHLKQVHTRA